MREEYPHLTGCLEWIAAFLATYLALALVAMLAGFSAAFWFGAGAFLTAIVALWEAGKKHRATTTPANGDHPDD